MCGRYSLAIPDPLTLRLRFGIDESVPLRPSYNIAPGREVLAVTSGPDAVAGGAMLWWGFLPGWAKDPSDGFKMINARSETVTERRAYSDAFKRRRCLICADGYYEWQPRPSGPKQPFHIRRADHAPFAFAGLWSQWHRDRADARRTCTILTRAATDALEPIHARMPVIVAPELEREWLSEDFDASAFEDVLSASTVLPMVALPIGTAVNNAANDGAELLDEVDESRSLTDVDASRLPQDQPPANDTLF